ncbi:MAG: PAS domain S-box protein [Bacteroidia bacterium]
MEKPEINNMDSKIGFESLFEHATEGILVTDNSGTIVKINPSAERMFGYAHDELLGKKIEELIPQRLAKKHIEHRDGFNHNPHPRSMGIGMNLFAKRKDNSEFPVEVSLSPFESSKGEKQAIAFIIDITIRKQQEDVLKKTHEDLQHSAEELKASNAELENFAYISSHDLQEPLRKIQSFGDRLKIIDGDKLSEQGKDYLDRMQNAAGRMQNLINDLLKFSRLSTKEEIFEEVNLNKILKEVLEDLEVTIEKTNAKIEFDELPVIEASPVHMRQLFQNLISNAIKFRKESEAQLITISNMKKTNSSSNRETVEIHFKDNGIGFDEKYNDRIFNIFQRLDGKKHEGSGIGLAICRKICMKHGGNIIAKSSVGKGSEFIVTLKTKHN